MINELNVLKFLTSFSLSHLSSCFIFGCTTLIEILSMLFSSSLVKKGKNKIENKNGDKKNNTLLKLKKI